MLLMIMMLACGGKDSDTAVEQEEETVESQDTAVEPAGEPAQEEQEDTASEPEDLGEDTATEE